MFSPPMKCFASCTTVRCMSSRTVPNDPTPVGFPGPVQWPSPVGVDDALGVTQEARSGWLKIEFVKGA